MSKHTYVVCDHPDEWGDGEQYDTRDEAIAVAVRAGQVVVELTWEFTDSELVKDFRPDAEDASAVLVNNGCEGCPNNNGHCTNKWTHDVAGRTFCDDCSPWKAGASAGWNLPK